LDDLIAFDEPAPPPYTIIDGGTDCGIDAPPYDEWHCCNGSPCPGLCVREPDARVECRCGDTIGGCNSEAGDICCLQHVCENLDSCYP
jgi:hypothetical protein